MKIYFKIAISLMVVVSLLTFSNCKDPVNPPPEPEPTQQEIVLGFMTSGTWSLQSVTVDGQNAAELFPNLAISFTETGFSATNGGPVWPSSGTWQFANDEATKIKRGDNIEVTITTIDASAFKFTLKWDKTIYKEGGRSSALAGEHTFTMKK